MHRFFKRLTAAALVLLTVLCAFGGTPASALFDPGIELKCDAFYMVNTDRNEPVFEKNADKQKYPASLTKVMTVLIALEYCPDPESVTVTIPRQAMNDPVITSQAYTTSGLKTDEVMSLKDLMYCTMLSSDNYAALSIACNISSSFGDGSVSWFVERMNARAQELGCTGTNFENPHGLFSENHYSTARDLYLITAEAMKKPFFAEMVSCQSYKRPATNMNPEPITLVTTNHMLTQYRKEYYDQRVTGVKTGFLSRSGHCLISCARSGGSGYMIVALDDGAKESSADNFAFHDSSALYDWAFDRLRVRNVLTTEEYVAEVAVEDAKGRDALPLIPADSYTAILDKDEPVDSIHVDVEIPQSVKAPVEQGEVIGKAYLSYQGTVIWSTDLVAAESVERSSPTVVIEKANSAFTSIPFFIFVGVLALFLLIYAGRAVYIEGFGGAKRKKAKKRGGSGAKKPAQSRPAQGAKKPTQPRPSQGAKKPAQSRPSQESKKPVQQRPSQGAKKPAQSRPSQGSKKPSTNNKTRRPGTNKKPSGGGSKRK